MQPRNLVVLADGGVLFSQTSTASCNMYNLKRCCSGLHAVSPHLHTKCSVAQHGLLSLLLCRFGKIWSSSVNQMHNLIMLHPMLIT